MELYRYRLQGRSLTVPSRVIHLTVTAANADDARRIARIRCSDFGTTLPRTGVRRVGRVVDEPEQADGMTQAKRKASLTEDEYEQVLREFAEWRGCEVEVV